jgi:hypothetical protein
MIIANWGKIVAFFRTLPGQVIGYLTGLAGRMFAAGQNIVRMLANGMGSMASAAVDRIRNIVGAIRDLIPGSPVKTGPLRSLNNGRAGRLVVGMLADGMEAGAPRLRNVLAGALDMPRHAAGGGYRAGAGPSGGSSWGPQRFILDIGNADGEFARAIRMAVRVRGGGSVERTFGKVA